MERKPQTRHIESRLREALSDSPATLIHGPRQCGKTTLAQILAKDTGHSYYSLDDENLVSLAESDPMGFVSNLPYRVIIDEVQRAPRILHPLKMEIDKDRSPGRYILTGSANLLRMKATKESLAGRMDIVDLHPFSQCEINNTEPEFLDELFGSSPRLLGGTLSSEDYGELIVTGGYPPAVSRIGKPQRVSSWYSSYIHEITESDPVEQGNIRTPGLLRRLLECLASQTGQLLNINNIAGDLGMARPTIEKYLDLLETMFLVERLPAYSNKRLKRLMKSPKIHVCDTGIASRIMKLNSKRLELDRSERGHLLETFVFRELVRQSSAHKDEHSFYYYRNRDGVEVDIVLERHDTGELAGIECKSSMTVNESDFKGLRKIRDELGDRFVAGVVMYEGNASGSFGDRLYAMPLSSLWQSS